MNRWYTGARASRNARPLRLLVVALATAVFVVLGFARAAHAATITVTTPTDEFGTGASCSLREAIIAANTDAPFGGCPAGSSADTITFGVNGVFVISIGPGPDENNSAAGDFDILSSITFSGNGTGNTIISAVSADRVFDISPLSACNCTVNFTGLTIRFGRAFSSNFNVGGGIYIGPGSTVIINDSALTDNQSTANTGGAIENRGTLTLNNVTLQNNTAFGPGGAINSIGALTVSNSTFSGNRAERGGALMINTNSSVATTISGSTFTSNQSVVTAGGVTDDGGAIAIDTDGTTTILGSTFTGNSAANNGGAIYFNDSATQAAIATLTMSYSRIVGNSAIGLGSGLYRASGTATAQRNWWGCNAGPSSSPCNLVSGTVNYTPWIVLRHTASPTTINTGQTSTLTADFLSNSDGSTNTAGNLTAFTGLPVTFGSAVLGTISNATNIQANGAATATFTANSTAGAGSASATVDSQTVPVSITIIRPSTTVVSINRAGTNPTNAASVSWNVVFATSITGLTTGNFTLVPTGLSGTSITGVSGSGTNWTVTASTGSGTGALGLNMTSDTNLSHSITNLTFTGQTYTVDLVAPNTTITSNPADPTNSTSATFTFSGTDTGTGVASFECKLDAAAFATCPRSQTYSGLAEGSHTFEVRAVDAAGNADASPASFTWTVDVTRPDTTITSFPSSPTNSTSVSFSFTGSDSGSGLAGFQCQIDGGGYADCISPQVYTGLSDGSHTFQVRAVDRAGNVDATPANFAWTIDTVAPDTTLDSTPPNPSTSSSASFSFSGTDNLGIRRFECQIDGGGFALCTSPQTYTGLADGSHTFQVHAVDLAGNIDSTPASFTWVIDTTPPDTTITDGPTDPTNSTSASLTFTGSDTGGSGVHSFECALDGASFAACTSPQNFTGLSDGNYTFRVRARDVAGNVDQSPAMFSWEVDTTPPTTTITAQPANPSNSASASFSFSGNDGGGPGVINFECQLDGGGFTACISPQTYSGLPDGSHTFQVRAIDAAGNVESSPASFTWVIDTAAPTVTINQAAGQADATATTPIHFTVVFNEPVAGFGSSAGDVTLSGSAGATTAVVSEIAPNNGTTFDVVVSGMTASGTVIATVPANAATDAAGNGNTASTSSDNTVTFIYNRPPVAVDDAFSVLEDWLANVSDPGVLENDSDPDPGNTLTAELATGVSHGSLTFRADGSFTYTPTADYYGEDTFTYIARDNHLAASAPATVTMTITPVNDAPTFTPGGNVFVLEDSGAFSQPWATNISAGPANESTQLLTFTTVAATPALFAVQPQVALDGTLTFTPAPNANGATTVTVTLQDSGGTANGGVDRVSSIFTIIVLPMPDISLALTQTVGTDPATCATTSSVSVFPGTTLYFCYTVANSGDITFTHHSLENNVRGPIFSDLPYALAPGTSATNLDLGVAVSQTVNVSASVVSTWTSVAALTEQPQGVAAAGLPQLIANASAQAQVAVVDGRLDVSLTVGLEASACPATTAITATTGTDIYFCATLTNPGAVALTGITLTLDGQSAPLPGVTLAPGQTITVTSAQLALLGPLAAADVLTVHVAQASGPAQGVLGAALAQSNTAAVSPAPTHDPDSEEPQPFRIWLPWLVR